jgi:hypothetical protein
MDSENITRVVRHCPVCGEDNIIDIPRKLSQAEEVAMTTGVPLYILLHDVPFEIREMLQDGIHTECREYLEDQ